MIDIRQIMERERCKAIKCDALSIARPECPEEVSESLKWAISKFGGIIKDKVASGDVTEYTVHDRVMLTVTPNAEQLIKGRSLLRNLVQHEEFGKPMHKSLKNIEFDGNTQLMTFSAGLYSVHPYLFGTTIKGTAFKLLRINCIIGLVHNEYTLVEDACFIQVLGDYIYNNKEMKVCLTYMGLNSVENELNSELTSMIGATIKNAIENGQRTNFDYSRSRVIRAIMLEEEVNDRRSKLTSMLK